MWGGAVDRLPGGHGHLYQAGPQPTCASGSDGAVRDARLDVAWQRFEQRRAACQLIDPGWADVARWIEERAQRAKHWAIKAASDPGQISRARDNFDVRTDLVQQGRRLERTLTTADHHHIL